MILPDGVVGMTYTYTMGPGASKYRKIKGKMDSGLRIIQNRIKGKPNRPGKYHFKVQAIDQHGMIKDTWYTLRVIKARLKISVNPQTIRLNRNRAGIFQLTYTLSAAAPLDDVVESSGGVFLAGSRKLGSVSKKATTRMAKGKGRIIEKVTVPLSVIKAAQRLKIGKISYQRTFTTRFMDAVTTRVTATIVGTGFSFTKIRIYFADDKSSKKFVKRNEKSIGAEVELRYEGAGLLKGYWQADDRILARVTRNMPFANARTIILKLPKVPPLPTHTTGSHRLRFVITEPAMHIPFPRVIYIVTGEDLSVRHPIHLVTPLDNATVLSDPLSFSWKPRHDVAFYQVEIFSGNSEKEKKRVFSAISKSETYTLPPTLFRRKLSKGIRYFWKVTGLDSRNKPVARSQSRQFIIDQGAFSHVSGRLLVLLDGGDKERNTALLDALVQRYHLVLVERKFLPNIGRELVFFTTEENVEALSRQLDNENQGLRVQPDYFYSTLGEVTEEQNRKAVFNLLHLKTMSRGKGVRVAIIDTGVDLIHDDLAPNLVAHANYVKDSNYCSEIHGTAVAGIIGAVINGNGTAGIAPESSLIALRACEQLQQGKAAGRCYSSAILQAIDGAMAGQAQIVNMSLGTAAPDNMVASALSKAVADGIIVVAPAGNDPDQKQLAFPARHPDVISIAGALDGGRKFPNNEVAARADCILPSQYILATLPGNKTSFMNGTSMASAEAAGLFAVLHPDPAQIGYCRTTDDLVLCLAEAQSENR
jgi:hypothetical protein